MHRHWLISLGPQRRSGLLSLVSLVSTERLRANLYCRLQTAKLCQFSLWQSKSLMNNVCDVMLSSSQSSVPPCPGVIDSVTEYWMIANSCPKMHQIRRAASSHRCNFEWQWCWCVQQALLDLFIFWSAGWSGTNVLPELASVYCNTENRLLHIHSAKLLQGLCDSKSAGKIWYPAMRGENYIVQYLSASHDQAEIDIQPLSPWPIIANDAVRGMQGVDKVSFRSHISVAC